MRCWEKAQTLAGLEPKPGRGWHSLRRKFASDLMNQPLKVLCKLGGRKTIQTVLQCYQRADEGQLRKALNAVQPSPEPEQRMWTPPGGQARILRRVGGSLVRYCRMSGLLMRLLLAAGPYGVREIRSKSGIRARRPSAINWFF